MSEEILSRYNPKETEEKWYRFWEENNLFCAKPNPAKKPYCIVIPPPNVTGILHMGHALNNTIQDILIRYHRMKGFETLWMPGTDHAGIATQNVVEKALAKEGLTRKDLGREKFLERVWQWRKQYGSTIIKQLKKLGASCDWRRERFTMDEEYSEAVKEAFVRLYKKNLIYQGTYIINWCPRCLTALSDEEVAHKEINGNLYYLKYPLEETESQTDNSLNKAGMLSRKTPDTVEPTANYIVVATTRPETMLGDTAVAVNPKDKRYKKLIGKTLRLPLTNRKIKIIADTSVDMKFGTGAVKVTPSHDKQDYFLAKKHNLEFLTVMNPDATMNESAGNYQGLDRFKAREKIIEDLKTQGLLEKIEPYKVSAGHCYRCNTIVEPYLSKQWFVRMAPLAKPAIKVVKEGRIKFYPSRWTKIYLNWMKNIQDWCISRQIWWGHRLPVYYCNACNANKKEEGVIVSKNKPDKCPICGSTNISQNEDVLDTWFSSWLWPFATFYWPQVLQNQDVIAPNQKLRATNYELRADLNYFYPTSVLVTAPEIIFFWVARMIMAGLEFMGEIPFHDVYIHGTVRDAEGKKMSKSLGNSIDPLEVIEEYGTDALRFSIISITAQGQDVFLAKERFEQGRNFANKIWNASRFILMNLEKDKVNLELCLFFQKENLNLVNRWILSRFYSCLSSVEKCLEKYKFNEAANLLYSFFWHEFCDWYLEIIKSDIKNPHYQLVMYKVLEKFLRVLHPFMPFITEEIWQRLLHEGNSIMVSSWPHIQQQIIDKEVEKNMEIIFKIISTIRNMCLELEISPSVCSNVKIYPATKTLHLLLEENAFLIKHLTKIKEVILKDKFIHQPQEYVNIVLGTHIAIPLEGVVDLKEYLGKIEKRIEKISTQLASKKKNLANKEFLKRAPKEIIETEKEKLKTLEEELKKMRRLRDGLKDVPRKS